MTSAERWPEGSRWLDAEGRVWVVTADIRIAGVTDSGQVGPSYPIVLAENMNLTRDVVISDTAGEWLSYNGSHQVAVNSNLLVLVSGRQGVVAFPVNPERGTMWRQHIDGDLWYFNGHAWVELVGTTIADIRRRILAAEADNDEGADMSVPERTPEQRLEALAQGRTLVAARAAVKKAIHDGSIDIATVLQAGHRESGDSVMAHLEVYAVVNAVRGMGPVKTSKLLDALAIEHSTHLAQLSQNDVNSIVQALA